MVALVLVLDIIRRPRSNPDGGGCGGGGGTAPLVLLRCLAAAAARAVLPRRRRSPTRTRASRDANFNILVTCVL